ncbi:hypothetical protein HUU05_25040 [candidate division KSB1 bacterium]|nr:hypothetical protein [candidate division KSB1 bacterium]
MKLPNAQNAVIAPDKLIDYLLNVQHKRGGSKARLLLQLGYRAENWQRLEADIRRFHLNTDVETTRQTDYGSRYEIRAALETPSGRTLIGRSIWQVDLGTDFPRLITLYPD